MTVYRTSSNPVDDRLREARLACAARDRLGERRPVLVAEVEAAARRLAEATARAATELDDVLRYEGGAWAFLYDLFGDRAGRLTKEQHEAQAALLQRDEATEAHARLVEALDALDRRWSAMAGAAGELAAAHAAKLHELRARGGAVAEQLDDLAQEAVAVLAERRAIGEATAAGARAVALLEQTAALLASARSWGVVDIFDPTDVADLARRGKLADAKGLAGRVHADLALFRLELADVSTDPAELAAIAARHQFLDGWFDSLFADFSGGAISSLPGGRLTRAEELTSGELALLRACLAPLVEREAALEARARELALAEQNLADPP